MVEISDEFMEGCYPVREGGILCYPRRVAFPWDPWYFIKNFNILDFSDRPRNEGQFLNKLADTINKIGEIATKNGYKRAVAFFPDNWFRDHMANYTNPTYRNTAGICWPRSNLIHRFITSIISIPYSGNP
ncbi:MAG: hypothetical protein H5T44_05210 [Thermoplasmatales archaeon]|nr:hypothetical protein [Thermoplasmatales archaeon]